MRMWNVPPRFLCRQHLLGEHFELHKLVGHLRNGRSVAHLIEQGFLDLEIIMQRHAALTDEMRVRGFKHDSPLPPFTPSQPYASEQRRTPEQDVDTLVSRCGWCRLRQRVRRAQGEPL